MNLVREILFFLRGIIFRSILRQKPTDISFDLTFDDEHELVDCENVLFLGKEQNVSL